MRIWISNKLPGIVHAAGPKTAVEENFTIFVVVIVQLLSHAQFFATPWTAAHQASLSITVSWGLLRFMSIESMMLGVTYIHPFKKNWGMGIDNIQNSHCV